MRTVAAVLGTLSLVCGATVIAPPARAASLPSAVAQPVAAPSVAAQFVAAPSVLVRAAPRTVYLTFDDGPNGKWTPRYLDVLKRYDAKATFFVTGRNVKAYPKIVARIDREGHLLANHTWSHPNLTRLSKAGVKRELTRTQRALGRHRTECMRPPYGATNASVRRWTKQTGLRTVLWDVDSRDWENSQTSGAIHTRVVRAVRDDSIVLMHDGGDSQRVSLAALKRILPKLRSKGYTFEVLPNC